ncbi:DEAD-box ATP-dependent RNA helicase 40 [Forsythia ovata]|uniref:DEAD-box ATP-dependent RNA helicase 40 n=1 Tax=Forsythia ovata TaxID=205694 RepID=A0ABD1VF47_9LAMI
MGFSLRYDLEIQQGKQTGFSPAHIQQTGTPTAQNLPARTNSIHAPKICVQPSQTTQYGRSSVNMPQVSHSVEMQQSGADLALQSGGSRRISAGYVNILITGLFKLKRTVPTA